MFFDTFKDTVFYKESSNLKKQYDALVKLKEEYPNNNEIDEELFIVKKGLDGENEIRYQLSKSNLGLYVIHDLNIEFEGLKAQIDYIVISKMYCYFIECKNLVGKITVNDKGDFIREYCINGKKIKKGMYSPLRQVEAQRDVYKKIWNNILSENKIINSIRRMFSEDNFKDTYRTLVVVANNESILNTRYASKSIKYKVIKSDALVRQIEYDLSHSDRTLWSSKAEMERWAYSFIKLCSSKNIDYYQMYKEKFITETLKNNNCVNDDILLKEMLIEFRKNRSKEKGIPAYFVFNNDELEELIKTKPKDIEELKKLRILPIVKINTHGKEIIDIINKSN